MDIKNGEIIYSPTDLVKFLESPYASWLDHYCLLNPDYKNKKNKLTEEQQALFNLGNLLEANYYRKLESKHFKKIPRENSIAQTGIALMSGYEYIAQAHLKKGQFEGFADLLVRIKVDKPTNIGKYAYTVKDIKRSAVPKAKFIIQICCYLEMLADIQQCIPEEAGIILGSYNEETFKVNDFYNYYLNIKELFLEFHNNFDPNKKPLPNLMESLGDWHEEASNYLKEIDSLLLLPSVDSEDIKKLESKGINTRKKLLELTDEVSELSNEALDMYKLESDVQLNNKPFALYSHNEKEPKGLLNLPILTENDLIIDIKKSDSYHKEDLFYSFSTYNIVTGMSQDFCFKKEHERGYISKFLRKLKEVSSKGNIYFFGNSVLDTLQTAISSQGIFLETFDKLKFNNQLIDLQLIMKQSLAIPFPDYSLDNVVKIINPSSNFSDIFALIFNFYYHAQKDDKEEMKERLINQQNKYFENIVEIFFWMNKIQEENNLKYIPKHLRYNVKDYSGSEGSENTPEKESFDYNFNLEKYQKATQDEKIGILLKQLIGFHKNEKRPKELETLDLLNQTEVKLEKSTRAISFLKYRVTPNLEKPYIREYLYYKNQEFKIEDGDVFIVHQQPSLLGKVVSINKKDGIITLQFKQADVSLIEKFNKITIIENNTINTKNIESSIIKTAISFDATKPYLGLKKALYDFLSKNFPDIKGTKKGANIYSLDKDLIEEAQRVVRNMNNTILMMQGPPGAGKTFTTRKIVYDLILEGKRIAVSSNSHKAIDNVINALCEDNPAIKTVKFGGKKDGLYEGIKHVKSMKDLKDDYHILGGTVFTLCNDELEDKFDYLFVDEAGQVSIPNLIAMSKCAKNIILIGDQMQLDQPLQAIHPGDSGKSCLSYYLGDKKTIPANWGFFLPETRRMNSELTKVISDNFYEGKLTSYKGSNDRRIVLSDKHKIVTKTKGCQFILTDHDFNSQYSMEEVEIVKQIRDELIGTELIFDGKSRKIKDDDIIYVSPYNMQVKKLKENLGEDTKVGSVDLFQGQEAPIVIISLASSGASSRGLEFLLSENRMNVAISRGQALAIIIGNKGILKSSVQTLKELKLLNLLSNLIKE